MWPDIHSDAQCGILSFWHMFLHTSWHIFWHVVWHSVWPSVWPVFWRWNWHHNFWHSTWHLVWHTSDIQCGILPGVLAYYSTLGFFLANLVTDCIVKVGWCPLRFAACSWEYGMGGRKARGGRREAETAAGRQADEQSVKSSNPHLAGGKILMGVKNTGIKAKNLNRL